MNALSSRRLFAGAVFGAASLFGQSAERRRQRQATSQRGRIARAHSTERERLNGLIRGYQATQMIYVAAKLRIADHLKDGARKVADLASAAGAHEDSLYRLMRALAGMGIFSEGADREFRLNPAAEYLLSGAPGSLRVSAEVMGEEWTWKPWGALLHSVLTGETANDHIYGKNAFDWFREHPEAARLFDAFQAEITAESAGAIVAAYDFSTRTAHIVDIGGGNGTLLAAVLNSSPSSKGVLFDLDHVVRSARGAFDRSVAARCEFVAGDFFKSVPTGGDLYLMKYILHDWNDVDALRILAVARKAMGPQARLLVVEDLVCGPNEPCGAKPRDIGMLVRTGGRNRTEREYRNLLSRGGFETVRVLRTSAIHSIVEARPRA